MGTSASVPLDIEAFRPQRPPDLPVQSDGHVAAVGIPADVNVGLARAAEADGAAAEAPSAEAAAAAAAAAAAVAELSSSLAFGSGGGEGNSGDYRQEVAGVQDPREAGVGEGARSTAGCVVAPTHPTITGKRSRAAAMMDDGSNSKAQGDGPPEKRTAPQTQPHGWVGIGPSELPEPATPETSDIDVGDSSPNPNSSGTRPDAAGVFVAAFNAMNGDPPTEAAEKGALAALAGIVTNPVALSVDPPQHDFAARTRPLSLRAPSTTSETLVVAPARPQAASGGSSPPEPQLFGVPPIDVGVEGRESGDSASRPPVRSPVMQPMPSVVNGAATGGIALAANGRALQAPPLTQHVYAVSPQPAAAATAFGAAVGGIASHLGAGGGLVSFAAAGGSPVASIRHHPPLVPPMPAGAAGGGDGMKTGGGEGGGAPKQKKKRSGPAAGKRQERRKCGKEGCKLRPTFGTEGTRLAQFCKSHKPEGFVNVLCKRCDVEGCKHQPSFGMPGAKPVRCATHRSDGMVNLAAPKCVSPGCRVVPSFAAPSARRASACSAHRRPGDVDIVTRRCHHEGCTHRPVFGDMSVGKALYCNAHKLDGMMNVFSARCTTPTCMELATFGSPGVKRPTHCAGHRDQQQHVRITSYHS
eukprot:g11175.t1